MLINDVLREFLNEIKIGNYTPRTIKSYKYNLAKFFKYYENELEFTELEEITHLHINQYLNYLKDKGKSATYINTILKNIRSFYEYCYKDGYCINTAKKVNWFKEKKVIINTFSDKEVRKMLDVYKFDSYINARNKCIIAVLFGTGIRNLELCNIKRTDVRESVIYFLGKGNKERLVPISPYLKKAMIRYECIREEYLKDNILHYDNYFLSYRNRKLTIEAVERIVRLCGKKANIDETIRCSPHTCSHYYAQSQLRNGLDVYSLSRLLGHETVYITKRYLQGLKDNQILELSVKIILIDFKSYVINNNILIGFLHTASTLIV